MAYRKRRRGIEEKGGCVLIVSQRPQDADAIAPRVKAAGYAIELARSLEEAAESAGRRAFEMIIFCGASGPQEGEILNAARAQNSNLDILHIRSTESVDLDANLQIALDRLSLKPGARPDKTLPDVSLDGLFDGVIVVDCSRDAIVLANAPAADLLLYSEGELNGTSVWRLIPEDAAEDVEKVLDQVLSGTQIEGAHLQLKRKDGRRLHCRLNAVGVGGPSQKHIQIVFQEAIELRSAPSGLSEPGHAFSLGQCISGIVHEMNNPLAAILGYAQLALTTTSRKKLDEYLQTIYQQAGRCQTIVQKLSSLGWRNEPQKKVTDLNSVVKEIVSLFSHELKAAGVEVKLDLSRSPLPVLVDPGQLQQVFVNLFNNAKEALAGTRNALLSIETQLSGENAVAIVSDNGPGIPDEIRSRVFQPFFSAKPNRAGLGLSICRSILHSSEGEVEVASRRDKGATFRIRLPLAKEALLHDPETDDQPHPDFPSGKTILIIDDEKPIVNLVRQILTRAGQKVDVALTPAAAYKKIGGKSYDMILIDIKLPGGDGKEIFRRIKQTDPQAAQKVVFCTGDLLDEETRTFLSDLENCVVEKPFSVSRIYAVAKRVL